MGGSNANFDPKIGGDLKRFYSTSDELVPMASTFDLGATLDEAVAALRLDGDGRIVDATEEAAVMLGFTPETMHGLTLGDLAADQWREMADGATARILCGDNRTFQLLLRGKSGRRTLVQMTSRTIKLGDEMTFVLAWSEHFPPNVSKSSTFDAPELRRLANGLLRTREAERSRVAAELDSGIAPLIVVAKFMIEDAMRRLGGEANGESVELLNGASSRLREALGEVRRIATELRPSMLDDLGLLPTIEWLCRTFEQTYRTVRVDRQLSVGESDLPDHLKLVIFRIVEEALTNVAQHANASQVQVALMRVADELLLWVQDNGDGFDAALLGQCAHQLRGIGLASIRKRIEATGGQLALEAAPNRGARIGATWNLPPRAGAH
jgi:two-component system NarL family sensor kinase